MRDLPRILAAYEDLDALLEQELGSAPNPVQVEARQILNDQAYVLLCWGQLDVERDGRSRDALRQRRQHSDWQVRRAWDLYNPDERRFSGLSFEDRVPPHPGWAMWASQPLCGHAETLHDPERNRPWPAPVDPRRCRSLRGGLLSHPIRPPSGPMSP